MFPRIKLSASQFWKFSNYSLRHETSHKAWSSRGEFNEHKRSSKTHFSTRQSRTMRWIARNYHSELRCAIHNYSLLSQSFHFASTARTTTCHWTFFTELVFFLFLFRNRASKRKKRERERVNVMYSYVIACCFLFRFFRIYVEETFQSRQKLTRLLLSSIIKQNWIAQANVVIPLKVAYFAFSLSMCDTKARKQRISFKASKR